MGDREILTVVPVAQGDALATGFTLIADQSVSTLHRANWVVVCLVPTGGTISSLLGNDPAVSLWVEVSQLCLVMSWPWVGLSLEDSREEVPVLSVSGPSEGSWVRAVFLCTPEGVQTGFSGCEVPLLWLPKLPLGCSCCLWTSKESLSRFWQRQNCFPF